DSPYQAFSAFAGNPYLLSPEFLVRDSLLSETDLAGINLPPGRIDYGRAIDFKVRLVRKAWDNFKAGKALNLRGGFDNFKQTQASWLDDYALFRALKDAHGGRSWLEWEQPLIVREPAALGNARKVVSDQFGMYQFGQFLFFRQWRDIKKYANDHGIR